MCEYCGCQAIAAIDELTREHDLVVNLISDVQAAHGRGDTERMAAQARRITAILGPHTAVEEQGLFPALTEAFPDHVTALTDEHRRIEAVLDAAAIGTPTDPAWPDELISVLRLLRQHILKEQDGVFPAALGSLSPTEWDAVEAVRAQVGTLLPPSDGQIATKGTQAPIRG